MLNAPQTKIMSLEQAVAWRSQLSADAKKLVLTNGCFDLLHRGHAEYLFQARSKGDALMVLINSDDSIKALKGPSRPINAEQARAFILGSLYYVDSVVIFNDETCSKLLYAIKPDIYVKGADYNLETMNQEEKVALQAVGAKIEFIEFMEGFSTTKIISELN